LPGESRNKDALHAAEKAFKKSSLYKMSYKIGYDEAFKQFVFNEWNPSFAKSSLSLNGRYTAAIFDLLLTAPWSVKLDKSEDVLMAGRYFVESDSLPIVIVIEAKLQNSKIDYFDDAIVAHQGYFINTISVLPENEMTPLWKQANDYRDMVFGRKKDLVPSEPTPAVRQS
jgi:hypothetical protein